MPKLDDLLGTRTLDVPFGTHTIQVTYRLSERVLGKTDGDEGIGPAIVRLVESWDIEGPAGTLPVTEDTVNTVPVPVLRAIWRFVMGDDGLGEASSSSDAG